MINAREAALWALRDLKVVRVGHDHPGYIALWEDGLVTADPVEGNEDALDYRLAPGICLG